MSKVPERLIAAATELFAAQGYAGTSVRAVCAAADTNLNAVTYHFGGKQGLYDAVIQRIGNRHLASAQRILASPAATIAELETRLVLFAEETLAVWLEERGVLKILFAEVQQGLQHAEAMAPLSAHAGIVVASLTRAQEDGLIRPDVDVGILAGALLERLNGQVLYLEAVRAQHGVSVEDPTYRSHWVRQTVALLLHGSVAPISR